MGVDKQVLPMKGYKVTNAGRTKLCGVACRSLSELINKGCTKLNIAASSPKLLVQTQDGTIIDEEEYFQTLPSQTIFIFVKRGEHAITGADIIYNALASVNNEYLTAGRLAREFLTTNLREKVREFAAIVDRHNPTIQRNSRSEDPDWFAGLDTRAQTKERYMFMKSQDRIRGYYYKTADDVKKSEAYKHDAEARSFIDATFAEFRKRLKAHEDFGCYFDRSPSNERRLCDDLGEFTCQGRWDKAKCLYETRHRINPYESREARVVFSTWNLDHGVERSRSVIPAILAFATKTSSVERHHVETFKEAAFYLLFTTENLKIVNIICHDKGAHHGFSNHHFDRLQKIIEPESMVKVKCEQCLKRFATNQSLSAHMQCHTESRDFGCTSCEKRFKTLTSLREHLLIHTLREKKFVCVVCNKGFTKNSLRTKHMRAHSDDRPFKCTVCKSTFKQSATLRTHMLIHKGTKEFVCAICNKACRTMGNLTVHMKCHSDIRKYECPTCHKRFKYSDNLRLHSRYHSTTFLFQCTICSRGFVAQAHLKRHHISAHSDLRPFNCQCGKAFKTKGELKSHAIVHDEVKHFSCDICLKTFTRRDSLNKHSLNHNRAEDDFLIDWLKTWGECVCEIHWILQSDDF